MNYNTIHFYSQKLFYKYRLTMNEAFEIIKYIDLFLTEEDKRNLAYIQEEKGEDYSNIQNEIDVFLYNMKEDSEALRTFLEAEGKEEIYKKFRRELDDPRYNNR